MDNVVLFVGLWLFHVVVFAVLGLPIVFFGRRRVHWYRWELLALVLPFCVWSALTHFWPAPSGNKGIENFIFGEPSFVALAIVLAVLIRVITGRGRDADERAWAAALLTIQCVAAMIIFFVTPNLGGSMG
jgi:ABC-type phosphate transport system permease subunit